MAIVISIAVNKKKVVKRTVLNNVIGPFSTVEYSVEGAFADHLTFDNPLEGTLVLSRGAIR